jgi:malate dehydrogenase (oxaloacetate-decarboxylating)(NADP+)
MLSSSNFGSRPDVESASLVRLAVELVKEAAPMLHVDGEMHPETALNEDVRRTIIPESSLVDNANLFVMPNPDVARIGYGLAKEFSDAMSVGPMTIGLRRSAHVVDRTISVRGLLNMIAMAVVEAQDLDVCVKGKDKGDATRNAYDFDSSMLGVVQDREDPSSLCAPD